MGENLYETASNLCRDIWNP